MIPIPRLSARTWIILALVVTIVVMVLAVPQLRTLVGQTFLWLATLLGVSAAGVNEARERREKNTPDHAPAQHEDPTSEADEATGNAVSDVKEAGHGEDTAEDIADTADDLRNRRETK